MGGIDVIVDGVAFVIRGLHGIWRRPLFGEMDFRQRRIFPEEGEQFVILAGDVQVDKCY